MTTRRCANCTVTTTYTGRLCESLETGTGYLQLRNVEARKKSTEISG
jgi:hypothetical protein